MSRPRLTLMCEYGHTWSTGQSHIIVGKWCGICDRKRVDYYPTLEEARSAVHRLGGCTTQKEYYKRFKLDPRLGHKPYKIYPDQWVSWGHYLQNGNERDFYDFDKCKKIVLDRNIGSCQEYGAARRTDSRMPSNPNVYYKRSWRDLLGKERKQIHSLSAARRSCKQRGIGTQMQYRKRHHDDPKLPADPHVAYSMSWREFFEKTFRYDTIEEVRAACRRLDIRCRDDYISKRKHDTRLPSTPVKVYETGSWYALFSDEVRAKPYTSLTAASRATVDLGISTMSEYRKKYKRDPRLPSAPNKVYASEWVSFNHYLGKAI